MTTAVGLRSERGPILLALMLSTALVAIDSTIIATAVPSIVDSIGGFSEFPWLFSIYLLAQAVTVPVYGKLADLFGRKPVLLLGIALFLAGSIMCGIAWNMTMLIAFRAVQGLGAGAVQPMSMTVVGDLYTLEERARVQGYIASVWGMSSVVGLTLGGLFSEYVSWRWIFFINIPLCLLAAAMIVTRFDEKVRRGRPVIDYRGAALLTGGLTLVVLGVLEGGEAWSWASPQSVVILVVGAVLLLAFVAVERRAPEPVLPLWVFHNRLLVSTSLVAAVVGAVLLGLSSYIPTYVQVALGFGPLVAGFALATLTLGWPISASLSGRVYLRIGFRSCGLIGSTLVVVGGCGLLLLGQHSSVLLVGADCFVIGLGMGLTAAPTLIAAQSTVEWNQRGVVTGNNMFFRSMGSAIGVAVFGAIANATLGSDASALRTGHVGAAPLTEAVHHVFVAVLVLAVLLVVAVVLMPKTPAPRTAEQAPEPDAVTVDLKLSVPAGSMPTVTETMTEPDTRALADEHLHRLAGPGARLRDDQWRAIDALVTGRRKVVVVQRTGWGKSAVYWIAAGLRRRAGSGPALVISPLLALMRDQVAAAQRSGLVAVTLNSANFDDWGEIEQRIAADEVDVLLISPERLNSAGFRARVLPSLAPRIGLLVVDEAHCVSDWGSDFRPDYRRIKDVLAGLPDGTPVLATTATANDRVSADVAAQLGTDTLTLRGPLDRESLALSVVRQPDLAHAYAWIADALAGPALPGSGLVYVLTVDDTTRLAAFLADRGLEVAAYSSATSPEQRASIEARLLAHDLRAVVATSSLGMGLDHPTLGFVVNLGAPPSPISYYQQVGRAGRALDVAQAVLVPTAAESKIWAYFDSTAFPSEDRVRRVLDVLDRGPTSVPGLEAESGLRRGRLETLLKVLDVDGAVERADGGWVSTGHAWRYDAERYAAIAAARRTEQDAMLRYERSETCLMRQLRAELDDPVDADCGRCAVCTGRVPLDAPSDVTVRAAAEHLRSQLVVLEPRKMWPSGAPRRGKIADSTRPEQGRALARGEDEAWLPAITSALADGGPVGAEVFDGVVRLLSRWGWPAGRPSWVTWVPSRAHDALLADLAGRLAELGRMQVVTPLRADGPERQTDAETSVASATTALSRLSVGEEMPDGPVLLLDDTTRSGFTLTVAAALLREAGAGPVYPLVLHKAY